MCKQGESAHRQHYPAYGQALRQRQELQKAAKPSVTASKIKVMNTAWCNIYIYTAKTTVRISPKMCDFNLLQ